MNEVTVAGVSLERRYGLVLTNDSQFNPPRPKEYLLDLPGGNGSLDVTEAFGDVLYEMREDTMVFAVPQSFGDFSHVVTDLSRFLHGRAYDYALSFDPGYVYHGRFSVDETYSRMHDRRVKVRVTASTYKSAGVRVHEVDAQAGARLTLKPGRGSVSPVFESKMPIHVTADGIDATLPAGSHTVVGLSVRSGDADVYVNTGGSINGGTTTWAALKGTTWGQLKAKRWHEAMWTDGAPPENAAYKVKISYEVLEL